jgi:catechol 2,3-dioxygenase-like lactoylglutathione lyase family enzyme
MQPQPLISTDDVSATSAWFQAVLGLKSGHGGAEYEQLMHDGQMVLQIHHWDAHDHPHLGDKSKLCGNGVVLWFQTDSYDQLLKRVLKHKAHVLEGSTVNPNANHREIWLRDPNGYIVVVASAYGDI